MAKVYPDNTFVKSLRDRGFECRILWQEKGPRLTMIAWHECFAVSGRDGITTVIVQTYKEGGYSVFMPGSVKNDREADINAIGILIGTPEAVKDAA